MSTIYQRILDKALAKGEEKAKGFCTSRQLRKYMHTLVTISSKVFSTGIIRVPQYWAIYYHEGRRVISPVSATYLVWFKNPKDDPRLTNGESPIYRSEIKTLNLPLKKLRQLKKDGKLFIVKRSPRSGSPHFQGNPFFSNAPGGGMSGFDKDVGEIAAQEAYETVERMLRSSGLKKKTIKRTIG